MLVLVIHKDKFTQMQLKNSPALFKKDMKLYIYMYIYIYIYIYIYVHIIYIYFGCATPSYV